MSLTISHPAAVAPFSKYGLPLSALVIGSLTPDYAHFIPLFSDYDLSHSMLGVFAYCLSWGMISLFFFHSFLKYPLLSLLPKSHQSRLSPIAKEFPFFPARRFLLIVVSVIIGAFTHIIWDSFTHPRSFIVQHFSLLRVTLFSVGDYPVRLYGFFQHGSTLVGGLLLFYWYVRWCRSTAPVMISDIFLVPNYSKPVLLVSMGVIAFFVGALTGLRGIPPFQPLFYYRFLLAHIFIVGVSVFMLELLLYSAYWHLMRTKKKAPGF